MSISSHKQVQHNVSWYHQQLSIHKGYKNGEDWTLQLGLALSLQLLVLACQTAEGTTVIALSRCLPALRQEVKLRSGAHLEHCHE